MRIFQKTGLGTYRSLAAMLVVSAVTVTSVMVQAEIVDFESTGLAEGDALTNEIAGLTLENAILVEAGAPVIAFRGYPDDDTGAAPFDAGFSITDSLGSQTYAPWVRYTGPIVVKFDHTVFDVGFAICDIDQGGELVEVMTATVFSDIEGTTQLEQVVITSGDEGTGTAKVNNVAFAATGIRRLEIDVNNIDNWIGFAVDNLQYSVGISVLIDIKPGSYPNSVNLGSQGVIPVAILTTEDFDATTVDPASVALAGAGVAVRGKGNKLLSNQEDVDGDGDIDLLVQVETENLDVGAFQDGYAMLTGTTFNGMAIEGSDEIRIVPSE